MVIFLAFVGVLVLGLAIGLLIRGPVLIGDRRALDRLSEGISAERRMRVATAAAMEESRRAARADFTSRHCDG